MLNVQTEHLENHTARLTVEVDPERLDQAMRQAARRIAKKARIPGFRPGKAPYQVVVNLYGREYVMGEALETLGNDLYREALEAAEIDPYAPGSLEDIQEDGQKIVFSVPKRPTVDLGDYRAIRVEHETQEVTDEMVDDTMESLRQNQAVVEPADRPAQLGDQVTLEHILVSVMPDDAEDAGEDEAEDDEIDDEADTGGEDAEDSGEEEAGDDEIDYDDEDDGERLLIHEHNYERVLRDDKNDLFPGFSAELVGLSAGDEKEFTMVMPEDDDDDELAGKTLRCEAHVEQVSSRTVPEWSDDLAKSISQDEIETMLELRMDVRKRLTEQAENIAKQQIADDAIGQMVEGADIHFPDELIHDYTSDLLQELDQNLRQQGLTLEDFMRITGQTEDDVRARYRDRAVERAERALVLGELVHEEQLEITADDVEAEIDRMMESLGGEGGQFRQYLSTEQSKVNISNQLATDRALDRVVAIARGEDPPIGVVAEPATEEDTISDAATEVIEAIEETNAKAEAALAEEAAEAEAEADVQADTETTETADETAVADEAAAETEKSD